MTTILLPAPADLRLTFGPIARPRDEGRGLWVGARLEVAVHDENVRASASSVVSYSLDHIALFARSLRKLALKPNAKAELGALALDAELTVMQSGPEVILYGALGVDLGNRLRFQQRFPIEDLPTLAGDFEAVLEALHASAAV